MRIGSSRTFLLATVLAAGACSADTTAPDPALLSPDEERMEAAAAIAEATVSHVRIFLADEGTLPGAAGSSHGTAIRPPWVPTAPCQRDPQTGRFHCPPVTWQEMTVTRSFTPYDADGAPMDAYDPLLTASVHFAGELTGVGTRPNGASVELAHTREMTVSGLLGEETERTWNGTATTHVRSVLHHARGTRSHTFDGILTVAGVVVGVPRSDHRWPFSGTMTHEGTATTTMEGATVRAQTRSHVAVVTFNGTHLVPLVIGGREFTLDLATGRISR